MDLDNGETLEVKLEGRTLEVKMEENESKPNLDDLVVDDEDLGHLLSDNDFDPDPDYDPGIKNLFVFKFSNKAI